MTRGHDLFKVRFRINHETCEHCALLGGQNRTLKHKRESVNMKEKVYEL